MVTKEYTVILTEAENKAMEHITYSVQEWIDNAVKKRAKQSIDDIYNMEVERMVSNPNIKSIPADKSQVVLDADIKTAKQFTDEKNKNIEEF
jgi:hypothetical protein